jgi:hypothetical protein
MSGAPLLASVRLRPEGGGMTVRARSAAGSWSQSLAVPPTAAGEGAPAITALYGREAVADLELDRAAGGDRSEIDATVERLGLAFGLATRLTSWVAISEEPAVDPRRPVTVTRIPQELPCGLSAEGLGLGGMQELLACSMMDVTAARAVPRYVSAPRFAKRIGSVPRPCAASAPPETRPAAYLPRATPEQVKAREGMEAAREAEVQAKPEEDRAPWPPATWWRFAALWVPGPEPGTWILKFQVPGTGFDWRPDATAQLIMKSGARIDVEVVVARTTTAGTFDPGTRITLGLRMGEHEPAAVLAVEIVSAGTLLRLDP